MQSIWYALSEPPLLDIITHTHTHTHIAAAAAAAASSAAAAAVALGTASLPHLGIKMSSHASKNAQCAFLPRTFSRESPIPFRRPPSESMYSISSSIKVPFFHLFLLCSYTLNDVHSLPSLCTPPSSSSHYPKTSSTIDSHSTTIQKSPDRIVPRAPAPPS